MYEGFSTLKILSLCSHNSFSINSNNWPLDLIRTTPLVLSKMNYMGIIEFVDA